MLSFFFWRVKSKAIYEKFCIILLSTLSELGRAKRERRRARERDRCIILPCCCCCIPVVHSPRYSVTLTLPLLLPLLRLVLCRSLYVCVCTHAWSLSRSHTLAHCCCCCPAIAFLFVFILCCCCCSCCCFCYCVVFCVRFWLSSRARAVSTQHLQTERCRKWKWISRDRADIVVDRYVAIVIVFLVTVHVFHTLLVNLLKLLTKIPN